MQDKSTQKHIVIKASSLLLGLFNGKIKADEDALNRFFISYKTYNDWDVVYCFSTNSIYNNILENCSEVQILNGFKFLFSKRNDIFSREQKEIFLCFERVMKTSLYDSKINKYYKHLFDTLLSSKDKRYSSSVVNKVIDDCMNISFSYEFDKFKEYISDTLSPLTGKSVDYIHDRLIKRMASKNVFTYVKDSVDKGIINHKKLEPLITSLVLTRVANASNRILFFRLLHIKQVKESFITNYNRALHQNKLKKIISNADPVDFTKKKFINYKNLLSIDSELSDILEDKVIKGIYESYYFNPTLKVLGAIKALGLDKKKILKYLTVKSYSDNHFMSLLRQYVSHFPEMEHLVNFC
jgi:hypothetical protein